MADKEQYVSEVREKMSEWDRRIEEIIEKADQDDKDSVLVEDLLEKQQEAKSRFEELEGADEAQYEDIKGRVSVATQALQDVLVRTSEEFQLGNPRPPSGSTRAGDAGREAGQSQRGPQMGARGERGSAGPSVGSPSAPQQNRQGGNAGFQGTSGGQPSDIKRQGGAQGGGQTNAGNQQSRDARTEGNANRRDVQASGGSSVQKPDTGDMSGGSTVGKERPGEAKPGEAQKRKST
jgi:hypothetical protein